ncbi:MAG: fused MFS/spermidine synthase [Acidobacteria bacterium]|nr:fused MFS/spermidine synthase [Acidobacteriota bacterium]
MPPRWFLLVYALSGGAALVYEVAWTRLLTLSLGHGVAAASTVLAAFMGGLAIGAAVAGPVSDRLPRARAMRVYAGLEVAIAVLALAMPVGLAAMEPLLSRAYADGAGGAAFPLLRLLTSVLLVALPAVAMGATFPVVARWYVPDAAAATRDAGALYAANTAGAAVGALVTGFVLLPTLGLRATTWTGVALNLFVAVVAWRLASAPAPGISEHATPAPSAAPVRRAGKSGRAGAGKASPALVARPWLAALAMATSGFLSLGLQIVWSRLLAQVLGPTTYAFSLVVAIFIVGLAIGALAGRRLAVRARHPVSGLSAAIGLAVLFAAAAVWTVDDGLRAMAAVVSAPDETFESVLLRQMLLVTAWLLPLAVALGCAFPFAIRTGTGNDDSLGADLGLIYAFNTIGAIAGALAAGFVIIPALGLHGSLQGLGVGAAVAALAVLVAGRATGAGRAVGLAAGAAALVASVALPRWDQALFTSGAYKYASAMSGDALQVSLWAGYLAYYKEGATATVAVRQAAGTTSLSIDGKVDASNAGDMLTQRLLAHVPLLLHPNPKTVAVLGLGSGVTLGSALTHPVERADILEISPEVVEASRFFEPENGAALRDPRTRLILGDGRTHILLGRTQYDAIISEPSNPWMAGIAALFTQEFFEAAKARLTPGGVLCQWAHTYDISGDDLKSIVATFASVFPDATLWLVGDGDILLIGSNQSLVPQVAALPDRLAARTQAAANLAGVGVKDAFALISLLVAEGPGVATFSRGAQYQTDDHAPVEFTGPRAVFSRGGPDNSAALRALAAEQPVAVAVEARRQASPASWRDRGWMLYEASAPAAAWADFETAVRLDPRDTRALEGLVRAAGLAGKQGETLRALQNAAAPLDHLEAQVALSRFLASGGRLDDAAQVAFAAAERQPSSLPALEQLASVLADVGDRERLLPVVTRLRTIAPTSDVARYYSASLLFMEGQTALAIGEAQALVTASPTHAKGFNLLGAALATAGRRDEAREALQASLKADARDPSTYTNLALLELEGGNSSAGLQRLAEALTLDPLATAARDTFERELAKRPRH